MRPTTALDSNLLDFDSSLHPRTGFELARIRTHRSNIHRYRRLLRTKLSDLERDFIERRMAHEQAALDALVAETLPAAFTIPNESPSASSRESRAS
ncbi:MAG TPA: hypothetical protein VFL62_11305 [Bradyrhizobium sp.]|uniref:hypothetical protein n=1 Tax=Bradyrhizobium sp. TaxID=376 RepID=UPI002D7E1E70|nr:hypothetical protein [Bradyrhizobium sp.]HET7886804.1 hypothetical protein [Bradyrhizobium sp.]